MGLRIAHLEVMENSKRNYILAGLLCLFSSMASAQLLNQESTQTEICDSFYSKISNTKATTIDQFLKELMQDPVFKQGVSAKSLMYKSRAMHGSTFENPRALIMFGMGDLVLAFNGSPEQMFYNNLESMCYNRKDSKFEFRAIEFPADQKNQLSDMQEVEFQNAQNLKMTKANPQACQSCHGSENVRPVWGSYLAWPGSYGSYEEVYNIPARRFTYEEGNTETKKLTEFMKAAREGHPRYKYFQWGYSEKPDLITVENALFGILVNYKMSHAALTQAIGFLQQPEKQKFKYAFAGLLLNCEESFLDNDNTGDLSKLMSRIVTERAVYELKIRKTMADDLKKLGENLVWIDTNVDYYPFDYSVLDFKNEPSGLKQMVTRVSRHIPDWRKKLTRFENLYNKMGLSTEMIHIGPSKTSWDGYNEIQDYMADYMLKYHGLPEIVPVQKRAVEAPGVHRMDLETRLSVEDYNSMKPAIDSLQLPEFEAGNKKQICKQLSRMSLDATHGH